MKLTARQEFSKILIQAIIQDAERQVMPPAKRPQPKPPVNLPKTPPIQMPPPRPPVQAPPRYAGD